MYYIAEKPENYWKEISQDFPFKGREAVKQKGLHGGCEGGLRRCTILQKRRKTTGKKSRRTFPLKGVRQ